MIDSLFWCINTIILAALAYYGYKKYLRASVQQQMHEHTMHRDTLANQAGLLQDACIRIKKETEDQEVLYQNLRSKVRLWKEKVHQDTTEYNARWLITKEYIETKRQQQYDNYITNLYKKALLRAVVTQATQELHRIFHNKEALEKYNARIFDGMKKS